MSTQLRRRGGDEVSIGPGHTTRVMALIGCSHLRQLPDQIRKLDALAQQQPQATIVADLSIVGRHELLREIADRGFVAAALPIYGVAERSSPRIDPQRVLDIAIMQMESGAGLLTIHPTPTHEIVELSRRRLVPWTSRGGGSSSMICSRMRRRRISTYGLCRS